MKLKLDGERPNYVDVGEDGRPCKLMEIACKDCRHTRRVQQVLHRFNLLGEHIETLVVHSDGSISTER